jgi:acetoin utilization protein AcuB
MIVDLSDLRVRDWLSGSLLVISPRMTIATALRILRGHAVPALPVWDGDRFTGMIYENELLRLTPSEATTLEAYELREVPDQMTVAPAVAPATPCAGPEDSLAEAAALLLRAPHGVIPVVHEDRPVGLLTWAGVLRAAVAHGAPAAAIPTRSRRRTSVARRAAAASAV